jgi:hypothetical protein
MTKREIYEVSSKLELMEDILLKLYHKLISHRLPISVQVVHTPGHLEYDERDATPIGKEAIEELNEIANSLNFDVHIEDRDNARSVNAIGKPAILIGFITALSDDFQVPNFPDY